MIILDILTAVCWLYAALPLIGLALLISRRIRNG
jgi:hypothetical protein